MTPHDFPPHALGLRGEAMAANRLTEAGWTIRTRGFRLGRREVDLVAERDGIVAFVEVKTRSGRGWGAPEESVTARKRREIETVARGWLAQHPGYRGGIRFDVVAIEVGAAGEVIRYEHLEDAWRPDPGR